MEKFKKFKAFVMGLILALLLISPNLAYADEISISGNGNESKNEASVAQENTNTVSQSNTLEVKNEINSDAKTGGNEASSNTGGSNSIESGNVSSNAKVSNSANTSVVDANNCCPQDSSTTVKISGNGENSENTASLALNNNQNITVNQLANIRSNITGYANTGRNEGNSNNGAVSINTGNITVHNQIENSGINNSIVNASTPVVSIEAIISGNGLDSVNAINFNSGGQNNIRVNNNAYLSNVINFFANTGNNQANRNNGKVRIATGDITMDNIINNDVNRSIVTIECCKKEKLSPPSPPGGGEKPPSGNNPPPPGQSGPPGSGGGGGGGNGGGGGQGGGPAVLGAAVSPVTGNNLFAGLTLSLILIFAGGLYLRNKKYSKPAYTLRYRSNTLHLLN